jgi:hypothetical protein
VIDTCIVDEEGNKVEMEELNAWICIMRGRLLKCLVTNID